MPRFIVKDTFFKKAKKEGYRARSAYKLVEIQQRFHPIKAGDRILDLGAAPGSWLQVESSLAGEKGVVLGVDILPIIPLGLPRVILGQADIRHIRAEELLRQAGVDSFDVVTSDIAPNLTGIKEADEAHSYDLYGAVSKIVKEGLRKGGNFVIKVFFGSDLKVIMEELSRMFSRVTIFKPKASRGVSSEVYLVCFGKR